MTKLQWFTATLTTIIDSSSWGATKQDCPNCSRVNELSKLLLNEVEDSVKEISTSRCVP